MARTAVWLLLAAVVAGVAVFALLGDGEDATEFGYDEVLDEGGDDQGGPGLTAAGARREAGLPGTGAYAIRGRIVDGDGKPVGNVPVEARRAGPAHIPSDPSTWYRTPKERMRRSVRHLEDPEAARGTVAGRARSDADGAFALALPDPGRYDVVALAKPPRFGTSVSVSVHPGRKEGDATLRVLPGSKLWGRVVDTADRPIQGTLSAAWWTNEFGGSSRWRDGPIPSQAEDGAFVFPAVPKGTVRLTVRLPGGRALSGFSVQAPRDEAYVIRIDTGTGVIEGVVTDSGGTAVAGTQVLVSVSRAKDDDQSGGTASAHVVSDADGRYRIADAPIGSVTSVRAFAEGYLELTESGPTAPWQGAKVTTEKPLTLDLTLGRGGSVHGRVTEEGGGAPIGEAAVTLYPAGTGNGGGQQPPLVTATGADGSYRIAGLPTGSYVAVSEKKGYFLREIAPSAQQMLNYAPGRSNAPPTLMVVVTTEGKAVERNLTLCRGLPVRGRVVDAKGAGVAQAEVQARRFGLQQVAHAWGIRMHSSAPLATSGGDGSFGGPGLPPHESWVLYARKTGYAGTFSEPFALRADLEAPALKLELAPGATVRGRVVGADAETIAQAQIGCWGQNTELSMDNSYKRVGADGSFELTGLPPGDCTLNVFMSGRQGAQKPIQGLQAGEVREGILVELSEGVEVSGVLLDRDGVPVPNRQINLQSLGGTGGWTNGRTDAEGRFHFKGVAAGRAQLMMWSGGGTTRLGEPFTAPKTDLRITFEPDPVVEIHGRVLDPSGDPIPFAQAQIRGAQPGGGGGPRYAQPGGGAVEVLNGAFRKTVTGKAPYTVTVRSPRDEHGKPLGYREAQVQVTDPTAEVVIRMERGLSLGGVVVDEKGAPMAGVQLRVGDKSVATDKAGRFEVGGLGPGSTYVQFGKVPGYTVPPYRQVQAGTTNLRFELHPGLKIKGVAVDADDKPLSQGWVSATWEASAGVPKGSANAQIQPNGHFVIDGVPPGVLATVSVQVWNTTGKAGFAPTQVDDVPAGKEDLVVRMGAGLALEGIVLDPEGKPAAGVFVGAAMAGDGGQHTGWMQTDEKGAWKLAGLKATRYSIRVMRQDGGAAPDPVEVDAPASGVRITLPKSASLAGRVLGLSADQTKGWNVRVSDAKGKRLSSARLAGDGTWSIPSIKDEGRIFVGVSKTGDDRYGIAGPLDAGRDDVVIRLKNGRSISGVIDLAGSAEEGVSVWAEGNGWRQMGRMEPDGRFEIRGLPPGRYVVNAAGHTTGAKGGLSDVQDGTADLGIRLAPAK